MSKFVAWYLVELDGLLRGRITADALHSLLLEIERHLTEAIEERTARGMNQEVAELAALEALGSPEQVAAAELQQLGQSPWVARGKKLALGGTVALAGIWLIAGFQSEAVFHPLAGLAFLIAAPLIALGVILGKQFPWQAWMGAAACGVIALAVHQGTQHVYFGERELSGAAARAELTTRVKELEALRAEAPGVIPPLSLENAAASVREAELALAKTPLQRVGERFIPALVAVTLFMGLFGGLFGALQVLASRRPRAHWLRRRLARA